MQKRWNRLLAKMWVLVMIVGLAAGCGSNSAPAGSEQAAESGGQQAAEKKGEAAEFPSREIKLIVPYSPGGGFDTSARLIAPFLEKYLSNGAKVVVENKPGGEGNIGLGEVYKAKPDGHTLGLINLPGNVLKQVMGQASFDVNKFEYVGRITDTIYVAAASKQSGFAKLEDLKGKNIVAGITNLSSSDGIGVVLAAEKLGLKLQTVPHEGSTEAVLSAIRGDTNFIQFPLQSIRASVVDGKELTPLWVYAKERQPDLPDTPTIAELGYPDLVDVVTGHRVIVASPGTPPEVLAILREAFQKAVNDPEYKEKAKAAKSDGAPGDHELSRKLAETALQQLNQYKERFQELEK
ncbi:tripartite tricarboxylate transporter substrate binding protein [Bacillaceae bacterium]